MKRIKTKWSKEKFNVLIIGLIINKQYFNYLIVNSNYDQSKIFSSIIESESEEDYSDEEKFDYEELVCNLYNLHISLFLLTNCYK